MSKGIYQGGIFYMLTVAFVLFFFSEEYLFAKNIHDKNNASGTTSAMVDSIQHLLSVAGEIEKESPHKALKLGEKALELSKQTDIPERLLSQIYFQLATASFDAGRIDSIIMFSDSVLSILHPEPLTRPQACLYKSFAFRQTGDNDSALIYAQRAKTYYVALGSLTGEINAILYSAKAHAAMGHTQKAMFSYFNVLDKTIETNDTVMKIKTLALIANAYMDIGEISKGLEYYQKALQLVKDESFNPTYGDILNNLGTVFYENGEYDSAYFYFEKAMTVYLHLENEEAIATGYQNTGVALTQLGHFSDGFANLHKALLKFETMNMKSDEASVMLDMGTSFIKNGMYDSAYFYLNKALAVSQKIHYTYIKKETLKTLWHLYKKQKNYQKALEFYTAYVHFNDSLNNLEMKKHISDLDSKYQAAQKEKIIQHLRDTQLIEKAEKQFLWGMIGALAVIFTLVLIFLFFRRRNVAKLHQQKVLRYEKEQQLDRLRLEQQAQEAEQMQKELNFKTKQLATHALNMMQKNKMLQDISACIEQEMETSDEKAREVLRKIKREVEHGTKSEKDWQLFKMYFEQINREFFEKLKKINPDLTAHDYRLSALIKLNMSNKEIASVLNISPDSLKNGRYRLKKKLKLKQDEDLNGFLNGL